jgi:S-adenosylmethionine decarboxylase
MKYAPVQHLLVDALDCLGPLDDLDTIREAMSRAARAVGATEVGQAECRYVPHGLTAVLFLAESHILVSTWPEHRSALFDVMLCDPEMDIDRVRQVLCEALGAGRYESRQVSRVYQSGELQSSSGRAITSARMSRPR